jgi:hypothetical protein
MGALALVAQRIEQKTFRLQTPPPHRTPCKGSRGEARGRAMGVQSTVAELRRSCLLDRDSVRDKIIL